MEYRLKRICFYFIFQVLPVILVAQDKFQNTLTLAEGAESPQASIESVAWISGQWTGPAFGGIAEEFWSEPRGGNMICVYKLLVDNEVQMFEICSISEENNTLILRLKHFNKDLTGWEDKTVTVDFPLVKIAPGHIYFDGLSFEKVTEDRMNVYVILGRKGSTEEVKFEYSRLK